ncbi:MAG: C39 family peptidase [Salinivirgaceae bacterium]|nr:C39 family peptidase [Salinivirgaceae bacterium]
MVEDAVTLNETDGYTVTSGYMPRGYQYGFIYKELTNARTIAHEIAHGAFHLEHTFAQSNYLAPEATTDNLMDYNGGTTLNHWQWQDVHAPKRVWLKWAQDESGAEMNENDAIVNQILATIHNANAKLENFCTIDTKGIGFESHKYPLGDKTIDVAIAKHAFEDVAINCNKSSCAVEKCDYAFEKEGSYIKFIFTTYTENESTNALEILVEEEYADELANWLFVSWEYLMTMNELTPQQIAIVRNGISNVEDETKRGELYLELQKKVPYHNQRDNNPSYKNKSVSKEVKTEKDRKYEADRMCNLTSVAMAFEMLGISKEDVYNKLVEDGFDVTSEKDKDFEDILDIVRVKKNFTLDRTKSELWEQIANYLGVEMTVTMVNSSKKNTNTINAINKALSEGKGVILSMYNNKGHIVRIQAISNDNIVVDDPYGNVSSMAYRELKPDHGESYQGSTNGTNIQNSSYYNGSNCTLTWDEIDVSKSSGRGGTYEVRGNQIYKSDLIDNDGKDLPEDQKKDYYVKDWINDRSIPGRNEYLTRTEIGNKTDRENNVVVDKNGKPITENITYYTAHGGMLKYYVVFSKKENKKQ